MADKFISTFHIQKLGHKIQEIRERALLNIISKLDNGVLFDNDLARSNELIAKLFHWFLLEPCTMEEVVFSLLKRILKSESGRTLIHHCGKGALKKELTQLRSYIEPQYYPHVDELSRLIDQQEESIVPPLESDVPLSYRTDASGVNNFVPTIGSTATPLEGRIVEQPSVERDMGVEKLWDSPAFKDDPGTFRVEIGNGDKSNLPNYFFQWQPLIEADRHVLQSVENSLRNPPQPLTLLHSCEFFLNVLLHDFPSEIFLQRPTIVLEFYLLLTCGSVRITNNVLSCLQDLTKALRVRIAHCNDFCMRNSKTDFLPQLISVCNTPISTNRNIENDDMASNISEKFERAEDVVALQNNQLSVPQYCFMSVSTIFKYMCVKHDAFRETKVKLNQVGTNLCLTLLDELLDLLCLVIKIDIWDQQQNDTTLRVLRRFNEILIYYGEALEYFRLESITSETNLTFRVIYLYLLHNCTNLLKRLIPLTKTGLILPRNLKTALSNSLLDVTLGRLYPEVYNVILEYVQSYCLESGIDHLQKYRDVKKVCQGMTATVRFLREHQTLGTFDNLKLAKAALPSIEFHKDFDFLRALVDICSQKLVLGSDSKMLYIAEEIILNLLAHNMMDVREETYRLCHRKVITNIGPKLNMSSTTAAGSQVLFLLTSKILTEISAFGMTSENLEIRRCAEDILTYILKCKILVCEAVYSKAVEALIPALPIIACHVTKTSALGKTVITLTDPDTAANSSIPLIVMLKSNVEFLFTNDAYLRDEAFSRICWLLASQDNSREMLPKFNTLYDTALANVCRLDRVVDVNKVRYTEHFYQPSSLHQVMDLLKSQNVEPVLRRSALNQVSVMVEDPLLHQTFLDSNGIEIVMEIMKSALTDQDYRDYPDSIVPIVTILKNICLYHCSVREQLSSDVNIFYYILRGLFLFFTEERIKQDATTLLFLLIFKDFIRGSPSTAMLSLPEVVCEKMHLPFQCNSHWKVSDYTQEDLKASIVSDRWCLSSIQIQWNSEIFGGFEELIKWDVINYDDHSMLNFVDDLKLSAYDLRAIKSSSISFCIKQYLNAVQNGTSHATVIESIDCLTLYIYLYRISKTFNTSDNEHLISLPWEHSLARFVRSLPSSEEDVLLLKNVVKFLAILVPFYKSLERECWIVTILKDSKQCLLDLLSVDSIADEDNKIIGQELLKLITISVCQEQHYLDYYTPCFTRISKPWTPIIKIIANNLKFNDAQHFYNLAYLDALLSCLVHLTANLGWSDDKTNSIPKQLIPQMISGLCELVGAFHCGKGPTAAVSVMGLSITRNVLLILNHLLAELQNSKTKGWEVHFLGDIDTGSLLRSFLALWASRDVVLRAAALQLFNGLAVSPRAAIEIVNEVKIDNGNIWEMAFTVAVDHTEAAIVRQNAVQLLANLAGHVAPICGDKVFTSNGPTALKKDCAKQLLSLLEEYDFYGHLDIILSALFTLNISDGNWTGRQSEESKRALTKSLFCSDKSSSSSSEQSDQSAVITTPSLVKSIATFLYNMLNLVGEDLADKLLERGLVKLFFRTLCNPSMTIGNTRELSLYCDILEMDTVTCSLLARLASRNLACLGTILHTKDCLSALVSLLNYKIYHVHLPQLIYLRNKLWTEIFNLVAVLIEYTDNEGKFNDKSVEVLTVFSRTLSELGNEPFLETLCESISCLGSNELQNSALTSLTSLLRIEVYRTFEKPKSSDDIIFETCSLQTVLDSVRTPRSVVISETKDNLENKHPHTNNRRNNSSDRYKINLLEEAYFGRVFPDKPESRDPPEDFEVSFAENGGDDALMAGAELCKILLHLYDIYDRKTDAKKRAAVTAALTGLLCISKEAKKHALNKGLVRIVVGQLREFHVRLSLESADCMRRVADKRRVCPILKEVVELVGLLGNFFIRDGEVKGEAAALNLADVVHKLWVWFLMRNIYLADVLRMICTYTTDCTVACQSLTLTSPVAGSGPRKTPSNVSLLYAIIALVTKEMDQISKTHDLRILGLCFDVLHNCCESLECRVLMSKSNLFQCVSRLHPAITKRQKPWESVELIWLEFLRTFTAYPEGQTSVAKVAELLELLMTLTSSARAQNRLSAILVLRNIAFYQPNKSRLLSSGDFLNILQTKLSSGSKEEKNTVVVIMWALAANCQKAKIILKSAHLDAKLQNTIKHAQIQTDSESSLSDDDLEKMYYVLHMLRDGDKVR